MSNSSKKYSGTKISKAQVRAKYKVITGPMKVKLRVIGSPNDAQPWTNPDLKKGKYGATYRHSLFVNVRGLDIRMLGLMNAKFAEFGGKEMPIEEFNFNLTKEVIYHQRDIDNGGRELPFKNEEIECMIDYATDKDGNHVLDKANKPILEIVDFIIPKAKQADEFDWDAFEAEGTSERSQISASGTSEEDTFDESAPVEESTTANVDTNEAF